MRRAFWLVCVAIATLLAWWGGARLAGNRPSGEFVATPARASTAPSGAEDPAVDIGPTLVAITAARTALDEASAAPLGPERDSAGPDAWERLARTDFDFPKWISMLPRVSDPDFLYRHRQLNPTDVVLDARSMVALAVYLRSFRPIIESYGSQFSALAGREEAELRGMVPSVQWPYTERSVTLPDGTSKVLRHYPLSTTKKGVMHFDEQGEARVVLFEQLPETNRLRAAGGFLVVEYAAGIVGWFGAQGALTREQMSAILHRVAAEAERVYGSR